MTVHDFVDSVEIVQCISDVCPVELVEGRLTVACV